MPTLAIGLHERDNEEMVQEPAVASSPTKLAPIRRLPVGFWVVVAGYVLFYPVIGIVEQQDWMSENWLLFEIFQPVIFGVTFSVLALLGIYGSSTEFVGGK